MNSCEFFNSDFFLLDQSNNYYSSEYLKFIEIKKNSDKLAELHLKENAFILPDLFLSEIKQLNEQFNKALNSFDDDLENQLKKSIELTHISRTMWLVFFEYESLIHFQLAIDKFGSDKIYDISK